MNTTQIVPKEDIFKRYDVKLMVCYLLANEVKAYTAAHITSKYYNLKLSEVLSVVEYFLDDSYRSQRTYTKNENLANIRYFYMDNSSFDNVDDNTKKIFDDLIYLHVELKKIRQNIRQDIIYFTVIECGYASNNDIIKTPSVDSLINIYSSLKTKHGDKLSTIDKLSANHLPEVNFKYIKSTINDHNQKLKKETRQQQIMILWMNLRKRIDQLEKELDRKKSKLLREEEDIDKMHREIKEARMECEEEKAKARKEYAELFKPLEKY